MALSIGELNAQQKELHQIALLNVFRTDAATVAARARGLFAAEGLEVAITTTPNSTDQMRGIQQRSLRRLRQRASTTCWLGPSREGAEIVAVAQISDRTVSAGFRVVPRSKAGAISGARSSRLTLSTRRLHWCSGASSSRTVWISIAATMSSSRWAPPVSGSSPWSRAKRFAGILNPPFDAKAIDAGMRRIGDSREVLPDYPNTIFAVNREWGRKNRDVLVAYLRAWLAGMRWVKDPANREEAVKLVGSELKLSPKAAAESVEELSPTGKLNLPGLETVLKLRTQFGFKLNMGDKLATYYDADYSSAAAGK